MHFLDLIHLRGSLDETLVVFGSIHHHADEGRNVKTNATRIHDGVVAVDDASVFQFAHALTDRRQGQGHIFRNLIALDAASFLKQLQDPGIDFINSGCHKRDFIYLG